MGSPKFASGNGHLSKRDPQHTRVDPWERVQFILCTAKSGEDRVLQLKREKKNSMFGWHLVKKRLTKTLTLCTECLLPGHIIKCFYI